MHRALPLLFAIAPMLQAQLVATGYASSAYIVGTKAPPSGLFLRSPEGEWQHAGYNLPIVAATAFEPKSDTIYIAAGNGLIRATEHGEKWRILTSWDVTELRDALRDPQSGDLYFAHSRGVRLSHDSGKTWTELASKLRRPFTETIALTRGALLAGTEDGVWRTADNGAHWTLSGASGYQVVRISASPQDNCRLLAVTQLGGIFASTDCGATFESAGPLGVNRNLYDVAYDPSKRARVAAVGFGTGVLVSSDGGLTWTSRNAGLPASDVSAAVFDTTGRLFVAVHDQGVFSSGDGGATWKRDGLPGSHLTSLRLRQEVR